MEWWEILGLLFASNENIREMNGESTNNFGEVKQDVRYEGRKKITTTVKPSGGSWNHFKRKT